MKKQQVAKAVHFLGVLSSTPRRKVKAQRHHAAGEEEH